MSPNATERIAEIGRIPPVLVAGFAVVSIALLSTLPTSPWEFDELLFVQGVVQFQPLIDHPAAPGYPLVIAAGKFMNFFFCRPFGGLVAVSVLSSMLAFLALALLFGDILGNVRFGVAGAIILYFSPVMLVHANLALSDNLALAFLALSLLAVSRGPTLPLRHSGTIFGFAAAGAIGTRPQLCIAVLPLMLVALWRMRNWRERGVAVTALTLGCLAWLMPLVEATNGPLRWLQWEKAQAAYFATHDAAISRGGRTALQIVTRFVAHPWGAKWVAVPVLALAVAGAVTIMIDGRWKRALPILAATIPYLIFAMSTMDPADAPRYAIPSLPLVSLLAVAGLERFSTALRTRYAGFVLIVVYMFASVVYVSTFVSDRSSTLSPPAQAAHWAEANLPRNAVILYDLSLRPHAEFLFRGFQVMPIDQGLRLYGGRGDVPLFIFADGVVADRPAEVFSWHWSDAYGKLTRNHYRVVSLVALPPRQRFVPLQGIYPIERSGLGDQWRWLGPVAQLAIPDNPADTVRMRFALSRETPFADNGVTVSVDGRRAGRAIVSRTSGATLVLPLSPGAHRLELRADKSFVPAENGDVARDTRRLAVKLISVEQLPAAPSH